MPEPIPSFDDLRDRLANPSALLPLLSPVAGNELLAAIARLHQPQQSERERMLTLAEIHRLLAAVPEETPMPVGTAPTSTTTVISSGAPIIAPPNAPPCSVLDAEKIFSTRCSTHFIGQEPLEQLGWDFTTIECPPLPPQEIVQALADKGYSVRLWPGSCQSNLYQMEEHLRRYTSTKRSRLLLPVIGAEPWFNDKRNASILLNARRADAAHWIFTKMDSPHSWPNLRPALAMIAYIGSIMQEISALYYFLPQLKTFLSASADWDAYLQRGFGPNGPCAEEIPASVLQLMPDLFEFLLFYFSQLRTGHGTGMLHDAIFTRSVDANKDLIRLVNFQNWDGMECVPMSDAQDRRYTPFVALHYDDVLQQAFPYQP